MFLKPFKVKTQVLIKGSDRKKLRAEVTKNFPNISPEIAAELVPNKEEMSVMKIMTYGDITATVYCLHKNPIFFEVDHVIYPTVYSLWKMPDALPTFTTWPPVFKNIAKGADLMLPGVIIKGEITPQNLGKLDKWKPCSVKLLGNKSPVAVGVTAMSSSDMYESAMRGKGVSIMHVYEDFLWAHGDKSHPPLIEDTEMLEAVRSKEEGQDSEGEAAAGTADAVIAADHGGGEADHSNTEGSRDISSQLGDVQLADEDQSEAEGAAAAPEAEMTDELSPEVEEDSRSPQERMDSLLDFCFKCALKSKVKKADLPLLTSTFFKTCMQPFCPAGQTLDVKKSSHKKLGKFLQTMAKEGYIKVKELSKGVDSIIEFDKTHLGLRDVQVPEVIETQPEEAKSEGDTFVAPSILELFTLTAAAIPFFKEMNLDKRKGDAITAIELRDFITDYVKSKDLQNKSKVTLDPILSDLVLSKDEYIEALRWEELVSRVKSRLTPAYQYTVPGCAPVLKKGKVQPVTLKTMQRAGNKKVTLVHHLEQFGIDYHQFASLVQKGVACSASVLPLEGRPGMCEVVVQGNQVNFIGNLLFEKYQLPKKYLQGMELAPKSGKKKR